MINKETNRLNTLRTILKRSVILLILSVFMFTNSQTVLALSANDLKSINYGTAYYDDIEKCDTSSTASVSGEDNIAKIFNYFLAKGYKDFQIAGMLGNMKNESGIAPQVVQGKPGQVTPVESLTPGQLSDPKLGYGLVQWTPVNKMIVPVREAGKDPNDLVAQLDFLWDQLEGRTASPEKKAGDHLKSTTDVASATISFETKYERHAGAPQPSRIADAEDILNKARGNGSTAATTVAPDPASTAPGSTPSATTVLSKVYILGDSITFGAEAKYKEVLGSKGITPTISAVTGRSWVGAGIPNVGATGSVGSAKSAVEIDRDLIRDSGAIVIALGTNGGLGSNPIEEAINTIRLINPTAPIYWVNIASSAGNVVPLVAPFNTKLAEQQTAGKLTVLDWAQEVNPGGDGTKDTSGLLADGIHPKPESYPKLVDLVYKGISTGAGSIGSNKCNAATGGDSTGLAAKVLEYAWPEYKPSPYVEMKPEYAAAVTKARQEGIYTGGIRYTGVDCGGFVTLLMLNSDYEPNYNYAGKGGATPIQKKWLDENWQLLGPIKSTSDLRPGDVAMQPGHTFMFIGTVPGFNSELASASLDNRAPMADKYGMTGSGIVWYRKK